MSNKILLVCFLLSLTVSYCSECTDKTDISAEEGEDECEGSKTSSNEKTCIYDEKNKKCVEKECSELSVDKCTYISQIYDESTSGYINCLPKDDKSGCQFVKCEDLTSNCEKFPVYDSRDEKCVLNSGKSKCEIQKCSELTSNCENFSPFSSQYKCVSNSNSGCKYEAKNCDELDTNQCYQYPYRNDETQCILNTKTNKCQLYKCQELPSSECSKFEVYSDSQTCAPYENNCKIQSCSELTKEVCETATFNSRGTKCTYSTEKGCTLIKCNQMTKATCGQFVPLDPLSKCAYDEDDEECGIEDKECTELSKGQCDLYNTEEYLEEGGKKCIEDDGKCVLDSKKIEYSILFLFLLFFVF